MRDAVENFSRRPEVSADSPRKSADAETNVAHFKQNLTGADVKIVHGVDEAELWRVTVNGRCLAGFYGPNARAQAERHREELMAMLACGDWWITLGSPTVN